MKSGDKVREGEDGIHVDEIGKSQGWRDSHSFVSVQRGGYDSGQYSSLGHLSECL